MSNVIKEYLVGLGFDVNEGELNKFNKGLMSGNMQAAALGASVLAAAGAVTAFVTKMASQLSVLQQTSIETRATADEINRLGYIASQKGSDLNAVSSSLSELNKNAALARMGLGDAQMTFRMLGVSVNDSNGKLKSSATLMMNVRDAMKGMGMEQQRLIMGRLGIDDSLWRTMAEDISVVSDEYSELRKASGLNMDEAAKNAMKYTESLKKLQFTLQTIGQSIAARFMGKISKAFDEFRKLLIQAMPKIIGFISPLIDLVLTLAEKLLILGNFAMTGIGIVLDMFTKLNEKTNGWAGYILAAVAAWKFLNLSFLASPVGIILSLAAAIALLLDDIMTFREGGDSLVDWSQWENGIQLVIDALSRLRDFAQGVFEVLFALGDMVGNLISGNWSGAFAALKDAGSTIAGGASAYLGDMGVGSSGGASVAQETNINVYSSDPNAAGRAVASEQNQVNANIARNMRGAAR